MSIVSLNQYVASRGRELDPASQTRLDAAAEQFEALFLQQILKQMRKASDVLGGDGPLHSRDMDTLRSFHDEVLAETLAKRRQTGIADMLVQQLSGSAPLDFAEVARKARDSQLPSRSAAAFAVPLGGAWSRGQALKESSPAYTQLEFHQLLERVIDRESSGNIAAVSSKGALGLMQLMPETAREMADQQGLAYDESRLTRDAAYNRQLGSAYLQQMLDRYDGHQALALAAYNAGPARVDEWLWSNGDPRRGEVSSAQWVERIPFAETRDYAQRILRMERSERVDAQASETTQVDSAAVPRFKPGMVSVALQEGAREIVLGDSHQSRSAAFSQSIRPER